LQVLLWCVLICGILSLRNLPGDYSHRLCGPWGCLPPIQALAAVHGAWVLVIATGVAWLLRTRSPRTLRRTGVALTCLGAAGLVAFTAHDLSTCPHTISDGAVAYAPQRLACSIAMAIDLPLVQTTIAGAATWYFGTSTPRKRLKSPGLPLPSHESSLSPPQVVAPPPSGQDADPPNFGEKNIQTSIYQ
jgi:hypothetical protein